MKVTFLREYTSSTGNVYRSYAVSNGSLVEVRVRTGFDGFRKYTNAEAKDEALKKAQESTP